MPFSQFSTLPKVLPFQLLLWFPKITSLTLMSLPYNLDIIMNHDDDDDDDDYYYYYYYCYCYLVD